jgi:uncharacterized membrane protein
MMMMMMMIMMITMMMIFVYLFKLQMGFLPGGSDTTLRHNAQITHITQNYRGNKGHTTQNEYNASMIYNYNKNNTQCISKHIKTHKGT